MAPKTHFLAFPLHSTATGDLSPAHSQLRDSIALFQQDEETVAGGACLPFGVLHFTLGLFNLPTADDVQRVSDVLQKADLRGMLASVSTATSSSSSGFAATVAVGTTADVEPLTVTLKGLTTFDNKSLESTSVLFPVIKQPTDRLYAFATLVKEHFTLQGFPDVGGHEELTLHATVLNTVYAKSKNKKKGGMRSFDARELASKWEGMKWTDGLVLDSVGIYEMGMERGGEAVRDDGVTELVGRYRVVARKGIL